MTLQDPTPADQELLRVLWQIVMGLPKKQGVQIWRDQRNDLLTAADYLQLKGMGYEEALLTVLREQRPRELNRHFRRLYRNDILALKRDYVRERLAAFFRGPRHLPPRYPNEWLPPEARVSRDPRLLRELRTLFGDVDTEDITWDVWGEASQEYLGSFAHDGQLYVFLGFHIFEPQGVSFSWKLLDAGLLIEPLQYDRMIKVVRVSAEPGNYLWTHKVAHGYTYWSDFEGVILPLSRESYMLSDTDLTVLQTGFFHRIGAWLKTQGVVHCVPLTEPQFTWACDRDYAYPPAK